MAEQRQTLGIDFGTSNSAAGFVQDGKTHFVEITPGKTGLPTTFFFDFETRKTLMGDPANEALLEGVDGRFMRALKRVLGTSLMHEKRQLLNERITFVDLISRFLAEIKYKAEAQAGVEFSAALSGRPVVFHGKGAEREAQAEDDLRACYLAAGFERVDFMPEPEAAAIASGALQNGHEIGLIVDIGGGTSDFSVFQTAGSGIKILANHGVRIGGTDFDRSISIDRVMPLLGKGTQIRKPMGPGLLPAPNTIFNDLATWEKIPFLYNAKSRRAVDDLLRLSEEPKKMARLATVLEEELGHELAFAVEAGKIKANGDVGQAEIALNQIEDGLTAELSGNNLIEILSAHSENLRAGALETVRLAGLQTTKIDRVIYVGGSSLMSIVPDTMKSLFPNASHSFSEVFTAVAHGLAIAAGRK